MYNFSGTHYEIGKQICKKFDKYKPKLKTIKKNYYEKQLLIYKKYYPELLDEIRGIADGLKLDLDKLTYNYLVDTSNFQNCSIFSYNGMIGRNYDWFVNSVDEVEVAYVKPKHFNSFVCVSDGNNEILKKKVDGITQMGKKFYSPLCGCDYINNKFLYIGLLFNYSKTKSSGLNILDFMRKISETCSNIKDVLKFIKVVPCAVSKFMFVSDSSGNTITIEHFSGLDYKVFSGKNMIHTNHILDSKHIKLDNKKARKESISRYDTIKNTCKKIKPKSLLDIKVVLDEVFAMWKGRPATIWQLLINLEKKQVYFLWKHKIYRLDSFIKN